MEYEHLTSFIASFLGENVLSLKYLTFKLNLWNSTQLTLVATCIVNVMFKPSLKIKSTFIDQKDSYEFEKDFNPFRIHLLYKVSTSENLEVLSIFPF